MTDNIDFIPPPKKSLGQHFLTDKRIVQHILDAARLNPEDLVLEIGPGNGCLTKELVKNCRRLIALELDKEWAAYLQQSLAGYENFELLCIDALQFNYPEFFQSHNIGNGVKCKLISNLPYYIATPLLQLFARHNQYFSVLVLMLPYDVANRIRSAPGNKIYGYISLLLQYHFQIETVCFAPAVAFFPRPKINSLVLKFTPHDQPPVRIPDEDFYWKLIKAAFAQRRKTLVNALQNGLSLDKDIVLKALQQAQIQPQQRAETLNLEDFARLADALAEE
ncbi:MAG: ribosomal RNA small subunit methyltransferase A [Candidatus Schekmanbacteria bacterium]|nr:ribosomal RNA small subunit methyltransferase A [Candidatus Schekmanbacteria bacterium]